MNLSGGIFLDEDEDLMSETPILDITQKQREVAEKKLISNEMLFPEEEEAYKKMTKKKKRSTTARERVELPGDMLILYEEKVAAFDPETATKKEIREFRKILTEISNVRYPRKPKKK